MYEFEVNHKMWDITNYLNCVFDFYQETLGMSYSYKSRFKDFLEFIFICTHLAEYNNVFEITYSYIMVLLKVATIYKHINNNLK